MGELFFNLYRKGGFSRTISILSELDGNQAEESDFFKLIRERGYYLNDFYRVKDDMLESGIISYKLNEDYEKVLYLTEKGSEIKKYLEEIEKILQK